MDLLGTASRPVVFTVLPDDAWGGDTDGGGPASGTPGAWEGLAFLPTAAPALLEHARQPVPRASRALRARAAKASPLSRKRSEAVDDALRVTQLELADQVRDGS